MEKRKIGAPRTKEEIRFNWIRRIMLWCLCLPLLLLLVQGIDNKFTVPYDGVIDAIVLITWAILEIESIIHLISVTKKEGFHQYWKFNKSEIFFIIISLICMVCSIFIPGMRWTRCFIILKAPKVLAKYNDENVFQVIVKVVAVLFIIFFIVPYFNLISSAISRPGNLINLLPKEIDFWGMSYVLHDKAFWDSLVISLITTAIGTVGSVIFMALCAYPLSKHNMPFRKTITSFFMIIMYFSGGMAPAIILMNALGLMDTIWALILPGMVSTYNMLLLRSFFTNIPAELEEAAKIDGAGNLYIFRKIILPIAKPMVATISFFCIVAYWNSYYGVLLYISARKELYNLPFYIRNFLATPPNTIADQFPKLAIYWDSVEASYLLLSVIPIMLCYPFIFKYVKNGVASGAVKG